MAINGNAAAPVKRSLPLNVEEFLARKKQSDAEAAKVRYNTGSLVEDAGTDIVLDQMDTQEGEGSSSGRERARGSEAKGERRY